VKRFLRFGYVCLVCEEIGDPSPRLTLVVNLEPMSHEVITFDSLPGDIIRYIAGYGASVAYSIVRLNNKYRELVRDVIPKAYGSLPIVKREVIAYAIHLFHRTWKEPVHKDNIHELFYQVAESSNGWSSVILQNHRKKLPAIRLDISGFGLDSKINKRYNLPLSKKNVREIRDLLHNTIESFPLSSNVILGMEAEKWIYEQRKCCMTYSPYYAITTATRTCLKILDHLDPLATFGYSAKELIGLCADVNKLTAVDMDDTTYVYDGKNDFWSALRCFTISISTLCTFCLQDRKILLQLCDRSFSSHEWLYGIWAFIAHSVTEINNNKG
jgi:hypothetical protein